MKPSYIRLQAFGPFVEEQKIDFNELRKNGLFLICGETGSGKTTILDAMTYALYGKSSGSSRGSIDKMRCNQAPDDLPTEVEFVFESQGKTYKFIRTVKKGRKNLSVDQNSLCMNSEGVFEPLHENPTQTIIDGTTKVSGDAEHIIGLSYEQFRQVIILPQGQFEKLLTADSAEKEAILVNIFKAHEWNNMSESVWNVTKARLDELVKRYEQVAFKLNECQCRSLEELNELIFKQEKEIEDKVKHQREMQQDLDKVDKVLKDMNLCEQRFVQYEQKKAMLIQEKTKQDSIEQIKKVIKNAEKADCVKEEILIFKKANQEEKSRKTALETATKKANQTKRELEETLQRQADFMTKAKKRTEYEEKLHRLEERKSDYIQMESLEKTLKQVLDRLHEKEEQLNDCKTTVEHREKDLNEALHRQLAVGEEHAELLRRYLNNISSKLACELVDDEPCPVCGSYEHPHPKERMDDLVTDNELTHAEEQVKQMAKRVEDMRAAKDTALEQQEKAKNEFLITQQEEKGIQSTYQLLSEKKIDSIKDVAALEALLLKMKKTIEQFDSEKEQIDALVLHKNEEAAVSKKLALQANNEYEIAKETCKGAYDCVMRALRANKLDSIDEANSYMLSSEQKEADYTKIASYETNLKHLSDEIEQMQKELDGVERPKLDEMSEKRKELNNQMSQYISTLAVEQNNLMQYKALFEQLTKQSDNLENEIVMARENCEFAKRLRGDTGISLQRYVLGIMLSAITSEANRLLAHVHGGRYHLYRTDESSGSARKAGLEFNVADSYVGEEMRSVKSLSGGEKFLVALSLAIGLSTVAQRRGLKLEAMFIDEGFGTLDEHSIQDALEVLSHLNAANGLVGIISHVQILRDNIPKHIEIIKKETGSQLSIN